MQTNTKVHIRADLYSPLNLQKGDIYRNQEGDLGVLYQDRLGWVLRFFTGKNAGGSIGFDSEEMTLVREMNVEVF